jgi:alkylation response protein AidB-like acyl-CoA dehydrogenase
VVEDKALISTGKIAEGDEVLKAVDAGLDMARIALGAEAVGAAQTCLARTVEYASERVQFGRAIGSFQAVKHQCADMMVAIEAAISAVFFAACAVSEDLAQSRSMAALAKVHASEALSFCSARMIQLHGGIGFTWEHDAHLYFKRARSTATMLGLNFDLDEVIAADIGLNPMGATA